MPTDSPVLHVPAAAWPLRKLQDHSGCYHYGLWADERAIVASDGCMMVWHDVEQAQPMPPTWRLEILRVPSARADDVIEVPLALGYHALTLPDDRYAVVRLVDCGEPYPAWRRLVEEKRKEARGTPIGFDAAILLRLAEMMPRGGSSESRRVALSPGPGPLSAVTHDHGNAHAIIMPMRMD